MTLKLKLLGGLSLSVNDIPITGLVSQKAEILLAYLAMEPREHGRESLATLLWEDSSQEQALANLRTLLASLKKHIAPCLLVTQKTLGLAPSAPTWVDALELQQTLSPKTLTKNIPQTENALALYEGEFLAGVYPRDSRELENWIQQTRDELRQSVLVAHQQLADHFLNHAQYAEAIPHAHALLRGEPTNEAHHRLLMNLLARSGQREAALAQYESCVRLLDEQMGLAPEPETTALAERLRLATSYVLPHPGTSFIGRQTELAEICGRLRQPGCRLLTLLGLGGSGKTRLALEVARLVQPDFLHGSAFVALHGVENADYLIASIAEALQFPLRAETQAYEQLNHFLQQKEILLVLDNCEHLLDEKSAPRFRQVVDSILTGAPHVKLLLTSRIRLGLQPEWLTELQGLGFDSDTANPAVELFTQRARAVASNFELNPENLPAVTRICKIVEGLPLGIELAAAWTRSLSCSQIAAIIEKNLDLLTTQLHDVPERQRSLRAVFDHVWERLDPSSQSLAARLGVFKSSFDLEAVSEVAKAPPWMMANLVEKSFLHMVNGRYRMIEALQTYVLEKLQQNAKDYTDTLREHSLYYLKLLHQQRFLPKAVRADSDNIRAVWLRLVDAAEWPKLETAAEDLCDLYIQRGMFQEGAQLIRQAIDGLQAHPSSTLPDQKRALGRLYVALAHMLNNMGSYESACDCSQKAINIGTELADLTGLALAYLQQGRSLWRQDKYDPALVLINQAMAIAEKNQLLAVQAGVWRDRSVINVRQHQYPAAREACHHAKQIFCQLGDKLGEGSALNNLGAIEWYEGNLSAAKTYFEQDLALCREVGDLHGENQALGNLGYIAVALGQTTEAERLFHGTLERHRHQGDRYNETWTLNSLGELALQQGQYYKMKTFCDEGLPISREIGSRWLESNLLVTLGMAYETMGAYETALSHMRAGLHIKQEIGEKYAIGVGMMHVSRVQTHLGNAQAAIEQARQALELGRELEDNLMIGEASLALGQAFFLNGDVEQAKTQAEDGLKLWQEKEHAAQMIDTRLTLAEIALFQNDLRTALIHVQFIFDILQHHPVTDTLNTTQLYLVCLQVLSANNDVRFAKYAQDAREFVQARASSIPDAHLRQSYLLRVAAPLMAYLGTHP